MYGLDSLVMGPVMDVSSDFESGDSSLIEERG